MITFFSLISLKSIYTFNIPGYSPGHSSSSFLYNAGLCEWSCSCPSSGLWLRQWPSVRCGALWYHVTEWRENNTVRQCPAPGSQPRTIPARGSRHAFPLTVKTGLNITIVHCSRVFTMLFYGPQLNMKSKTPPFVNLRQPVTDIEAAMQCTVLTLQASGSGKGKILSISLIF